MVGDEPEILRVFYCPASWCDYWVIEDIDQLVEHVNTEHDPELIPSDDDYQ